MLNLIDKEACGLPLLGAFAVELADHLARAMSLDIKADLLSRRIVGNPALNLPVMGPFVRS